MASVGEGSTVEGDSRDLLSDWVGVGGVVFLHVEWAFYCRNAQVSTALISLVDVLFCNVE